MLQKLLDMLLAESNGKGRARNANRSLQTLLLLAILILCLENRRDTTFLFAKLGIARPPSVLSLSSLLTTNTNNTNNYAQIP